MNTFDTSSFKSYDIRGIYPTQINEDFFYQLGRSVAKYIGKGPIGVGQDMRLSSPQLTERLIAGITDMGIDVIDYGLMSTEMLYFISGKYKNPCDINVTASHNPKEYNGAKMVTSGSIPLYSEAGFAEIKAFMNEEFENAQVKGKVTKQDMLQDYVDTVLSIVDTSKFKKDLKVVVDAGNGMGGLVWGEVMKKLPVQITPLYFELDGSFPYHLADPLKDENVKDLRDKILELKADIGIALDADCDRAFFMDETGYKLTGTLSTCLLAKYFLDKGRKGHYLYNANVGRAVPELVEKYGSTPHRTRVGHSFIKAKMREYDAIFAGEHSCHFYFKDMYYADCALLPGLVMLELLSTTGKTLSELRKEFDIYPQSGEINFVIEDSQKVIADLKEKFKDQVTSIDELDGVTFWFNDWWFICRLSGTEPLMRLNMEADTKELLDKGLQSVVEVIEANGGSKK